MQSIGLLFVHGIGEQKRFEHLRNSVRDLAELARIAYPDMRVSVVDRTADWKMSAGSPTIGGVAPMTISIVPSHTPNGSAPLTEALSFECHEVWWADLGARTTVLESIKFWIWGLGQWSALIYQHMDASGVEERQPKLVEMPESVAGRWWAEMSTRMRLAFVALATTFTLVTVSLVKFLANKAGAKFSSTILVQYLGDVRQYEQRATPGGSSPSDPGHPLRVGIRRRMVAEMVAMSSRGHHRWYVAAHSLGSVLAYNGLTELGHTLPNYLQQTLWQEIPNRLIADEQTILRDNLHDMMPARPPWLSDSHVINRKALFGNLRGFLTYGCPLDKFASLWPRIVASACDRTDRRSPFAASFEWLNVASPHDPVAGRLDQFDALADKGAIVKPRNLWTKIGLDFLVSHIRYFTSSERFIGGERRLQRIEIVKWLVEGKTADTISQTQQHPIVRFAAIWVGYLGILILALGLAAVSITVLGGAWQVLTSSEKSIFSGTPTEFYETWKGALGPALGLGVLATLTTGLYRWLREINLNLSLARHDQKYLIMKLLAGMRIMVWVVIAVSLPFVLLGALADFAPTVDVINAFLPNFRSWNGYASAMTGSCSIVLAIVLQCGFNALARRIRRRQQAELST